MNFDEWWNEDYDDKDNPFEKDSFGYWAYAGWCSAMQVEKRDREWVDLTDEEISQAVGCSSLTETYLSYFRKVLAKLKEKNNG